MVDVGRVLLFLEAAATGKAYDILPEHLEDMSAAAATLKLSGLKDMCDRKVKQHARKSVQRVVLILKNMSSLAAVTARCVRVACSKKCHLAGRGLRAECDNSIRGIGG